MIKSGTYGFLIFFLALSGCSQLMGSLRRDLDDEPGYSEPTVGGKFADQGFLADDPIGGSPFSVGHMDRAPSSVGPGRNDSDDTQSRFGSNGGERTDENGDVNYSNTPNLPPSTKRAYKNGARATKDDFIDDSQNEGSLWASSGQTNYYFTKNKIRGVGDIITVNIEPELIKDISQEIRKGLSPGERDAEIAAASDRMRSKVGAAADAAPAAAPGTDQVSTSAAAPSRSVAENKKFLEGESPQATAADIDVARSLELKPNDQMMGEIIERYPNGNYKIRATKKVMYKNGSPRLVSMVGVVKGTDISEDDVLSSGKIYEYRVEAIR